MSLKQLYQLQWMLRFGLQRKQPWLKGQDAELKELLRLCIDKHETLLISDLLYRFEYLDTSRISQQLAAMVSQMTDVWRLPAEETQVVASTFDSDPDSAQQILQIIKPEFVKRDWMPKRLVNLIGRSVRYLGECPNVILVDEFVGSGVTIAKRVRDIRNEYDRMVSAGKAHKGYTIRVCVLASMNNALREVERDGIDTYASLWLNKGISEYYSGAEIKEAIVRMLRLEKLLQAHVDGTALPSLGYNQAESLYKMETGNTPNSVFPIYWWPYLATGERRRTLLYRFERKTS
jgi:hypothetical protein